MSGQGLFRRLCHIFPAVGITDLKVECAGFETPDCHVRFSQNNSGKPFPLNGFYSVDGDLSRYDANIAVFSEVMRRPTVVGDIPFETVVAFLSLANSNRAAVELSGGSAGEYDRVRRLYTNCILLSRDSSASKMLNMIQSRESRLTFCTTDDEVSGLVPEPMREVVAEAFAGLALIAVHQKKCLQAVGFATAALYKHANALPYVNCARMVACARADTKTVIYFTEMVIIPFFIRVKNTKLHAQETSIWDPAIRTEMLDDLPAMIALTAQTLTERFSGKYGVMRAKFIGDVFVEKLCKVCGVGFNNEKLFRCAGCKAVYYCSRECQLDDWQRHKTDCEK
jgi:hypothetical protein